MRDAAELHGEDRHLVLHVGQIESPLVDEVVVQVEAFVFVLQHPVAHAVADVQEPVYDHLELPGVEPVGLFAARVVRGAGSVVRREYDEHFAVLDLREYERQKVGQIAVEPVIHVLRLDRFGTVGFADAARRIETDVQQVGRAVGAELELGDGLLGEAEYGGVARRGVEHPVEIGGELQAAAARLVLLLFVLAREDYVPVAGVDVAALFVERPPFGGDVREVVAFAVAAGDPFGYFGGVIGRRFPVAARRIEPEGFAAVPGHDDRRHRLGGNRDGFGSGLVLQERLGERRGYQVVGPRALAPGDQFHGVVFDVVAPAGADYAVRRRHGARGERGERYGRRGLLVVVAAVGEDRAPVQQAPEPAFAVVVGIPAEVFGAHRAYDDVDDQAGACRRGFECRQGGYGK